MSVVVIGGGIARYSAALGARRAGVQAELLARIAKRGAVVGVGEVADKDAVATAEVRSGTDGFAAFAEQASITDVPHEPPRTELYGRRDPLLTKARPAPAAYPPG